MNNITSESVIDSQVEIVGTVKSAGSIRIDGKLQGDLQTTGDATVGKSAIIKGNLNVNSVSVAGTINGNIIAKDRIEMKSSARLMGDIKAKRLAVEDGVTFVGKSEVNPSGAGPAVESAPAAAPAAGGGPDPKAGFFGKK